MLADVPLLPQPLQVPPAFDFVMPIMPPAPIAFGIDIDTGAAACTCALAKKAMMNSKPAMRRIKDISTWRLSVLNPKDASG